MRSRFSAVACLLLLVAPGTVGQTNTLRTFEVASVKLNHNPPLGTRAINLDVLASHGRLTLEALSLRHLILVAYEVQRDQVQGCPRWCDTDLFDVVAKAEDPNVTTAQVEAMLQKLLADRFH